MTLDAPHSTPANDRISTGIDGLDHILGGGLPRGHIYLLEGESGAGKTTVGLQFLLEGERRGEGTLWITLSETERELRQIAASHGWSLDGIQVCSPATPQQTLQNDEQYSFFSPADVELDDMPPCCRGCAEARRAFSFISLHNAEPGPAAVSSNV